MSYNVSEPLTFNIDYFLNGTIDPNIESIDSQMQRLLTNNLHKINKQYKSNIQEFRNDYLHKNLRDPNGNTVLHQLILNGCHVKYFRAALTDQNLDINAQNNDGDTPYHLAASLKSEKFLYILKEFNANNNIPNNNGLTVYQMRRL